MNTHCLGRRTLRVALAGLLLVPNLVLLAAPEEPSAQAVLQVAPQGATYDSVQAAIDAAPEGAIVRVAPGVYEESLTIRKPVVLEGSGWEKTTVAAPRPASSDALKEAWVRGQTQSRAARTQQEKKALSEAFLQEYCRPALRIQEARNVQVRGLKFTASDPREDPRSLTPALLIVSRAKAQLTECAVLGSPRDGIQVAEGSEVEIRRCLVAAVWGTGITVGQPRETAKSCVTVADCEVRNCHYAAVTIRKGQEADIRHCWISGAAWHGIRYDDASPSIVGNRIFANANCGIYASGKTAATVKHNLFLDNQMCGISCWFENADTIAENTLAGNRETGLIALGSSRPRVEGNIFFNHPRAVACSFISQGRLPKAMGEPDLHKNLFWQNPLNLARRDAQKDGQPTAWEEVKLPDSTASLLVDPGFVDPASKNFSLAADSAARREGVGAAAPLGASSPWPLQPEERAIIPEGPTRDSRSWKHPEPSPKPGSPAASPGGPGTSAQPRPTTNPSVSYEEAFGDLYEVVGREYPYFAIKGIDWKAVGRELLPRVKEAKTDSQFGLLCLELLARLEDSHAALGPGAASPPTPPMPQFDPGLACLIDDQGKPVVYYVDRGGPAEKAGVRPGMAVLSIQGKPAEEAIADQMKRLCRYLGYSSERYLRYHAAQFLPRQMERGALILLEMQDDAGASHGFSLPATLGVRYLPRLPVPIPGIQDSANVSWTMLDGRIGYLYVRRIQNDLLAQLDQAIAELKEARGLIIDVRGNSGGGFDSRRAHCNFSLDDTEEPARPRFRGPITLLIDPRCISAGEGWASWFVATKRAKLFGEATAGASSRKRSYVLKNGLYTVTFPVKAYTGFLDRPIERRGLDPDVPLRQNARDLAAGRDTVLEAAKRYIEAPPH